MKFIKDNIAAILLIAIAIAVLVTLQLQSWFHRTPKAPDHKEEIEQIRKDRDYYRGKYDSVISASKERDTVLIERITTNKIQYEKIPVIVNDYNVGDLRRAINERYNLP